MTDRRDDDFADAAEDLASVLRDLRDELEREAPRGPFGLPRPPSPSEVVRFADEVAIPGTIAILEVNIKLLETVQRAIRIVDTGNRARERASDAGDRASRSADRLADASDRTLRRLEDSLSDLQTALEGGSLPDDGAAGELLDEARSLREDVQARLREARARDPTRRPDHTLDDFEDRASDADAERRANAARDDDPGRPASTSDWENVDEALDDGVKVDVDAELETLKDRYGKGDSEEHPSTGGRNGAGRPEDDGDSDDSGAREGDDGDSDDSGAREGDDGDSDDSAAREGDDGDSNEDGGSDDSDADEGDDGDGDGSGAGERGSGA